MDRPGVLHFLISALVIGSGLAHAVPVSPCVRIMNPKLSFSQILNKMENSREPYFLPNLQYLETRLREVDITDPAEKVLIVEAVNLRDSIASDLDWLHDAIAAEIVITRDGRSSNVESMVQAFTFFAPQQKRNLWKACLIIFAILLIIALQRKVSSGLNSKPLLL